MHGAHFTKEVVVAAVVTIITITIETHGMKEDTIRIGMIIRVTILVEISAHPGIAVKLLMPVPCGTKISLHGPIMTSQMTGHSNRIN